MTFGEYRLVGPKDARELHYAPTGTFEPALKFYVLKVHQHPAKKLHMEADPPKVASKEAFAASSVACWTQGSVRCLCGSKGPRWARFQLLFALKTLTAVWIIDQVEVDGYLQRASAPLFCRPTILRLVRRRGH